MTNMFNKFMELNVIHRTTVKRYRYSPPLPYMPYYINWLNLQGVEGQSFYIISCYALAALQSPTNTTINQGILHHNTTTPETSPPPDPLPAPQKEKEKED